MEEYCENCQSKGLPYHGILIANVAYPGRTVVAILICAETKKKKHHSSLGPYQMESTKKLINLRGKKERMEGEHMASLKHYTTTMKLELPSVEQQQIR